MIEELGKQIKKMRELRNYTQEFMAQKLHISQQNYSKIEKGEVDFSVTRLQQIAEVLSVKPEDIFNFDERVVFNTNHQNFREGAIGISYGQAMIKEIQLIYESRINDLQKEIIYLRGMLEKAIGK